MLPNLDLAFPLRTLRGADYNPRYIGDDDLAKLRESLAVLGCVKPVIARGDVIVAGHQRTKAMLAEGIETGPVYLLQEDATLMDEASFNQLHNGTDMDSGEERARIHSGFPAGARGWHLVEPLRVEGNHRAPGANVRNMLSRLLNRFGPFGSCVATESGKILHAAQYALCCNQTMRPLLCYVVADADEEKYASRLSRTYGAFSYDKLPRTPGLQSMAQMYRLRQTAKMDGSNRSAIYEGVVLPALKANPALRVLDFGSGQGDYAKHCRALGYSVTDFEPFRRVAGGKVLDVSGVRRMADNLAREVRTNGLFDAVVCDSVLNSVDTIEAEQAVVTCLALFTKPGGNVWISARDREEQLAVYRVTRSVDSSRSRLVFLDENGFSAAFRDGAWFYQKYHTKAELDTLGVHAGLHPIDKPRVYKINNETVHAWFNKTGSVSREVAERSIRFEFNLAMGEGVSIDRADVILEALKIV